MSDLPPPADKETSPPNFSATGTSLGQTPERAARRAAWMMLGAGIAAAIAAFLPWYSLGFITVTGTSGDGQITLVLGLVLAVMGWARHTGRGGKLIAWVAIVAAALVTAVGAYHMLRPSSGAAAQSGVYATVASGIVGFVGAVMALRTPATAIRRSTAPPPGPPPGWHPDPWDPSSLRWWDGTTWSEHTARKTAEPGSTA